MDGWTENCELQINSTQLNFTAINESHYYVGSTTKHLLMS